MAGHRYFRSLEEMPVFTIRKFYDVCTSICTTKSYIAKQARAYFADTKRNGRELP
jgi:hypothetical protein